MIRICRPRGLYQGQFRAMYWINYSLLNSPCPCDARRVWFQTSCSTLAKVMSFHGEGTGPLPKPMLTYFQLDFQEQTSVKSLSKFNCLLMKLYMYFKMPSIISTPCRSCLNLYNVINNAAFNLRHKTVSLKRIASHM